jgi:ABC-type Zn uptake system ZnuABC Zn-binding protein ZnuA
MKPRLLILGASAVAVALIIGLVYLRGGGTPSRKETGKTVVAATIYPLFDMTRNVAGNNVEVKLILPPGASPHLFEFSPKQLAELQNVKIVFAIGHGLDDWVAQVINVTPGARLIVVDHGIELRKFVGAEENDEGIGREQEPVPADPHYWLHLGNARQIVDNIAKELIEMDPAHADAYRGNAQVYKDKLSAEEQQLRQALAPARGRSILTFHDAWFYFAEDSGLKIVGTFEPAAGQEPTPRYLSELQQEVRMKRIRIIFIEPQLSTGVLKSFAEDNGLSLAELDPLGGVKGRETYLELMKFNADSVLHALEDRGT